MPLFSMINLKLLKKFPEAITKKILEKDPFFPVDLLLELSHKYVWARNSRHSLVPSKSIWSCSTIKKFERRIYLNVLEVMQNWAWYLIRILWWIIEIYWQKIKSNSWN